MGDRLPIVSTESNGDHSDSNANSGDDSKYEELGGWVQCPSCKGEGRIAKHCQNQLVALIPFTDKRLKPSKTYLYVVLTVLICIMLAVVVLYFLSPRSLELASDEKPIVEVQVLFNNPLTRSIHISFLNSISVTNDNFFAVKMINATSTVIKPSYSGNTEVIGKGINTTKLSIPMKMKNLQVYLNHTLPINDWAYLMCEYYGYVRLFFQFTITFEYFGHQEQETKECTQLVCCMTSGNCSHSQIIGL